MKLRNIFFVVVMCLTTIPISAHDFEVDGIYYNITSETDKTVEVTYQGISYGDYYEYHGDVVIPESVQFNSITYKVNSIGFSAFKGCLTLYSITIPKTIKTIYNAAFSGCTGLTEVNISDLSAWCNISLYSDTPLEYAGKLKLNGVEIIDLEIPEDITSIETRSFYGCKSLKSVTFHNSITEIGYFAFADCIGLTSVTIPNSVTTIGDFAFHGCAGLTSATIGNSVTSIGGAAFSDCASLTSVTIPNSVTSIGGDAFNDCAGLTSVTIGNSVTSIGSEAFSGCTGLTEVNIIDLSAWCKIDFEGASANPTNYTKKLKLNGEEIKGLIIPNDITEIKDYTFYNCTNLTSVTIPNSVTSIGSKAFSGCTGLTSVTIGNSVIGIGSQAFYDCTGLIEVNFNATNCTSAGNVFNGCNNLATLNIGENVTNIPDGAFVYCTSLTEVTIPNSVTSIGSEAFYGCTGLTEITIPNSVTSIGRDAFVGTPWYNNCYGEIDGLIYIGKVLYAYNGTMPENTSIEIKEGTVSIGSSVFSRCTGLTSVTIPNSVTSIGDYAFYDCTGLTSVTIPNSVTSIGDYAFCDCTGLTSVTIPNSVTSIGRSAFYECTGLTSVTIGNSVTSIGSEAFSGCTGLTEVNIIDLSAWCKIDFEGASANPTNYTKKLKLNGEEIKGLIIPNDITEIKDYTFYNCTNLTSVTIPNSVTSIGSEAFSGCTGLTSVTIGNSVTTIGNEAFYKCTGLTEIIIPNSVTSIAGYSFADCTGLTSVTIGNSVTTIESTAFSRCTNLMQINAEEGNPVYFSYEGVLYNINSDEKSLYIFPPGKTDEYIVPTFLTSLTIPNVKSVIILEGSNLRYVDVTGYDCSLLNSLEIREPLNIIIFDGSNLSNCVNLKKLILPQKCNYNNLTLYKQTRDKNNTSRIFYTFHPIEILQLPNLHGIPYIITETTSSVGVYIVENANYYGKHYDNTVGRTYSLCLPSTLKQLIITDQSDFFNTGWHFSNSIKDGFEIMILKPVTNFENTTFQNSAITKLALDLTEIPAETFAGCANLKSLTLPFAGAGTAQTTSNFGELFGTESNSNMRAVTQFFEDGTNKTYYLPTGLEELVLTEGCEMIPYGGLYNCNMLKTLTLPTTLFMVGEKALYGCAKMTDIYCKGADPAVAYDNSFDGMRLTSCKLHVPYNTSDRYKMSSGWEKFYYIEEEAPLMVSVAKSIENAGVIYGINEYQPGQTAEMEAVAHSGYTFEGWYEGGALLTTDSKYIFTVVDSHNLVASFMPVLDENEVTVTPDAEDVTLSWASVTGASTYTVEIYEDADMIISAGKVTIDQAGQIVPMSSTVTTTIADLVSTSDYYYRVTAFSADNVVLSQFVGSFSTISGIEGVENDSDINYTILPGMLKIEGDDRVLVADMKGVILYDGDVEGDLTLNLEKGVYILKTQSKAYKVAIK